MSLASNYVALPELQASFPFDVERDFVPIGFVGEQPMLIAASPALGVNTLPEADRVDEAPARRVQHRGRQSRQHSAPDRRMAAQRQPASMRPS